ncbi:MAG: DUF4199 domain-containing protein [Chitinophagaceae bacterium]|nr:MAG: DUF4199 domain-containing protein [Chitinophagaceae bacterium]
MKLTPLLKGLITGAAMVLTTMLLVAYNVPDTSRLHYIVYGLYAGGIIWTLISFSRTPAFTGKFSELFGQGFRCFVVVTLLMVGYIGIYSFAHPEIAEERAPAYRQYLKENKKDMTPAEIDQEVENAKKSYVVSAMYPAVFSTLILGTIFTLAGSALVLMKKNWQ